MSRVITCTHYAGPYDGFVINLPCVEYNQIARKPFHVFDTLMHGSSVYALRTDVHPYEDEKVQVREYKWVQFPPASFTYHE